MRSGISSRIVQSFPGRRILVAGDLMLDRYWRGDVDRISPEAPVPVVRKTATSSVPGGAANTACNVAALGAHAVLFGVTGEDETGAELCKLLRARGIDCSGVATAKGRPTTVKLRIVAHNQQVVRVDEEDTSAIDAALADRMVARIRRLMARADAVLVSDYAKGFVTPRLAGGIIEAARGYGKPVVVDPKGADLERYRGATVIKPNRIELATLTGLLVRDHEETLAAARELLRRAGETAIVVTEGKDGMTLLQPDQPETHFPSFAREVYDVTGAGDTALATLAVALGAGARITDAVWLSNLAAGLAVGAPGTVAVSKDQLATALAQGPHKPNRMN